jgi:hypothetical protein
LQTKLQDPPEHVELLAFVFVHATTFVQFVPQVDVLFRLVSHASTALPLQSRRPVPHATQAPPAQVVVVEHAKAVPHAPLALQVWTASPEHCVFPGVQTPVQLPLTHAWFEQAVVFCHVPVPSQVCGCWPLHCLVPGEQDPEHAPPLQTFGQAVPFTHAPAALQVWGMSPLHCLVPGVQTPVQAPLTHA